jgi:hypothetical protein
VASRFAQGGLRKMPALFRLEDEPKDVKKG